MAGYNVLPVLIGGAAHTGAPFRRCLMLEVYVQVTALVDWSLLSTAISTVFRSSLAIAFVVNTRQIQRLRLNLHFIFVFSLIRTFWPIDWDQLGLSVWWHFQKWQPESPLHLCTMARLPSCSQQACALLMLTLCGMNVSCPEGFYAQAHLNVEHANTCTDHLISLYPVGILYECRRNISPRAEGELVFPTAQVQYLMYSTRHFFQKISAQGFLLGHERSLLIFNAKR